MRALVYTDIRTVELKDVPSPVPSTGERRVAIEVAGICGSDISGFLGHSSRRKPPLILGHELVGRTEDGSRVVANPLMSCGKCPRCLSGRQNLCASWRLLGMDRTQGAYAECVAIPEEQLLRIPDKMPVERAILVEPLANIVHLFRIAAPPGFARVAIVGAGTMGILALILARKLGFSNVLVTDLKPARLDVATRLGAVAIANTAEGEEVDRVTQMAGEGYEMVIDASGSTAARSLALKLCAPGGEVVLLGMADVRSEVDFVSSIRKEHRLLTSFAYTPPDFLRSFELLLAGEVDLTPWTASLPLSHGQEAFERMSFAPESTLKMLLTVGGEQAAD